MLPKTSSYHGETRVATAVPADKSETTATAPVADQPEVAATQPEAPATTVASEVAKSTPAPALEKKPVNAVATAPASAAATVATTTAPRKLNLVKAANTTQFKEKSTTAEAQKISGYLRTGIILLLVGLLVGIFSHLIGTIIALIGVIFIVLWLLDNL